MMRTIGVGMFPRIKTFLMLVTLKTIMFSATLITHPVVSPAAAQGQQYSFVTKWGAEGTGFGKFRQPLGIAIDSDNNLYVTDTDTNQSSNQIQKFAPNGTFITLWGVLGFGDGRFARATGIAIDPSDNVYVTDGGNPETAVQKFTANGTFITSWGSSGLGDGQFISPGGVVVDSSDNVYVGENPVGPDRIQKFDSNGNFIGKSGITGSGDGQFINPDFSLFRKIIIPSFHILNFKNFLSRL
jgi:tripartite motif-containing protein 71